MKRWLSLGALATAAAACAAARAPSPSPPPARVATASKTATAAASDDAGPPAPFARGLDRAADPCTDFYQFACGGWLASHPIPADARAWFPYDDIKKKNLEIVRAILEDAQARPGATGIEGEVGAYYAACMDEARIEGVGLGAVRPLLDAIDRVGRPDDVVDVAALLEKAGVDALAWVYANQDHDDARRMMVEIDRSSSSLPLRDDYLSGEPRAAALREKYAAHLGRVFGLLGEGPADAAADAARVVDLERTLADASLPPVARERAESYRHPIAPGAAKFPFVRYLAALGAPPQTTVNELEPAYFDAAARLLSKAPPAAWRALFRSRVVRDLGSLLPESFARERFDFQQRTLRGVEEPPARWKRCAALVDRDVGEALGELFVRRAFSEESRARVAKMFAAVRAAMRAELESSTWMSAPTRRTALEKLDRLVVRIGHPERYRDYASIRLDRGDAMGNAERAAAFELARQLAMAGQPVNRDEWGSLPQTLDGFHSSQLVAVSFTAAFLQPPVFDPRQDDAAAFGGLGAVMGHELTHAFDADGRSYDADGNLRDWWTPDDAREYDRRTACFVDQYSAYRVGDDHVDGALTVTENVADNGGLRLAYAASHVADDASVVDGFTAPQRFFVAWAQIRCGIVRPETARVWLHGDPHAPGRFRAIGPPSNMPEFQRAFGCPDSSPLVRRPACRLW